MHNLAIIPARGGSKRIPRKNIKLFCGKPMIAYAITAAKESGLFDHVVVSTEDEEIAQTAREWGAETPFVRPAELADDYALTVPVVVHAINMCLSQGWGADGICCIYPGVPFINVDDLQCALTRLMKLDVDYCFPVTAFPSAIQRALQRLKDGRMQPFYPEYEMTRTQDLEPAFYDAGQFYWGRTNAWLKNPKIHSSGIGYVIPNWRVVDIDTYEDWQRAENLFMALNTTFIKET
jgi:pseudaminic acid cytidylyltransferase